MATIAATSLSSGTTTVKTITRTTLTSSDTFTYNASKSPILILDNVTGGSLTVTIDGSGAPTALDVSGVGFTDLSNGFSTGSIAAGACIMIQLARISQYLQGTIAVTGGTGIKATLIEN